MLAALLLLAPSDGLRPPFLAQAGGRPIDVGGHAAPLFADFDGDGRTDLLVGHASGQVMWFRNSGSSVEPALGVGERILGGEGPALVPPG